ncbi:SRPBCC family protein [Glycomyces tenuis]|uniref:SRPBCC family protein n=1 Tax=Glycomyces tenuis TaxID=58116 RepID=UPI00040B11A6|nr:SRPBCC family protein [Glycomyces tenuis]
MATPDPIKTARLVTRELRGGSRDGRPTKIAVARRTYRAERSDVWDALTDAERLPRWFLPVSGDLSVGGRYQFEGNAGGLVERCSEPESLAVTWEFGGQVSWLEVRLSETDGGTALELVHEAHVDPALWEQFGPGAVGLGWDGSLMGLGLHLDTGESADPQEHEAWAVGPEGVAFFTECAEDWARAQIETGDDPDKARAAAQGAIAFYTTPPEAAQEG